MKNTQQTTAIEHQPHCTAITENTALRPDTIFAAKPEKPTTPDQWAEHSGLPTGRIAVRFMRVLTALLLITIWLTISRAAEVISVPSTGQTVQSSVLEAGQSYLLQGEGIVHWNGGSGDDYDQADVSWVHRFIEWEYGGLLGISGVLVPAEPQGWLGTVDGSTWAPHTLSPSHVYQMAVIGQGTPASFWVGDSYHGDNSGSFTITITPIDLNDGLVADYPFNGDSSDESGNGNDLTNFGATLTADRFGNANSAYHFTGASTRLERAYDPASGLFPTSTPFSISVWFRSSASLNDYNDIVSTHLHGVPYNGYVLAIDQLYTTTSPLTFAIMPYGNTPVVYSVVRPLNDGQWHHAVAIWDLNTISLYVDGVYQAATPFTGPVAYPYSIPFSVGNGWYSSGYSGINRFEGDIDDIRFYSRVITPAEVQALYVQSAPTNQPPTANAGPDQSLHPGSTVLLNGTGSFDDNTAPEALMYAWSFVSKPSGSTATLVDAATASPSFVADLGGTYIVQLVVTDSEGVSSTPDTVIISTTNLAPTAHATAAPDLVYIGETVQLSGLGSTDPEHDPLTYSWAITSAPDGSNAALVGESTPEPTLTPDVPGIYVVTLTVSDLIGPSAPTSVTITAATAEDYAEIKIVEASSLIAVLTPTQVTTKGNQTALKSFLSNAVVALQTGNESEARRMLQNAIERTDGWTLRGVPDTNGPGRDWITDRNSQLATYASLKAALDALAR